jgi:maleate cis-trans isomerase
MAAMTEGKQPPRRIGLLGPFAELPGEYADVVADAPDPAIVWQVVTEAADSHELEDLRRTARHDVVVGGARRLLRWRPDVIMWACTSGSFILGRDGAEAQRAALEAACEVPASSTSLAFVEAVLALNATDVDVISPYPAAATEAFVTFLREWGISVGRAIHLDHPSGRSSDGLRLEDFQPHLRPGQGSSLVLIPDTAVWGFELISGLRAAGDGSPVLVANQVTVWQAFRLAAMSTDTPWLGLLQGMT